jgi:long-chain acyl-CoA synthetase
MSALTELDEIRSALSAPGKPFELTERTVKGTRLLVYKNLPPNLGHLIVQALSHADRTFLVRSEARLTYGEVLGRAAGLAAILQANYGVDPGTRAAIAMRNSPEWVVAFLAVILTGATVTLINSRGTADEMLHALQDTECSALIADRRRAEAVTGSFEGQVITAGDDGVFRDQSGRVLEIVPVQLTASEVQLDDPAIIMFTSGTTGRPKGAVLTHLGVSSFLFGMRHNGAAHLTRIAKRLGTDPMTLASSMPQFATLAIFPFFHVSGASAMLLGALINGGKIVFMDRWEPATALSLIARERITMFQGPPSIFWDVLSCPGFADADTSSLTNIGIGGQATPPNLLEALLRAIPNAAPGGGYGMTETNGAIASGTGDEYLANPKASGRLLPGSEVRIVDDQGRDQPLGGVGEIWVKSPLVMAGYWNQPEANQAVFSDGWLKTGDVGYLDADRFITIVDRKKDVIIRGGENIYCAELERVFQEYPGVMEVAAFGVPDERMGERAVLAVVPHPGKVISADEMAAFGRTRLADYKLPSEITFATTPFARNAVGKIDKVALRQAYRAPTH